MVAQSRQTKLPLDVLVELYWYTMMNASAATQTSIKNSTSLNMAKSTVTIVAKIMTFRGTLFWDTLGFTNMLTCFFYNKGTSHLSELEMN
jgi:hypothetical protein